MSINLLTNLLFEPKGRHDPALAYSIKDTVMSADGSQVYFALQDVPAGIALSDEDYWILQIDLSDTKSSMDNAIADFANYAKEIGTRVRGETANASGNPVTFLPDAGSLLQPVTVLEPQQSGSGDPYPAGGGRNLLPNEALSQTVSGVDFVVNADGTITVNGTADANIEFIIYSKNENAIDYTSVAHTLSGCPSGGSADKYYLRLSNLVDGSNTDTGSSSLITATNTGKAKVYIFIKSGFICSNLVFKPMIRLASDTDATYAPYANIRPITGWDAVGLTRCGKNLLENTRATTTTNGITFTVNADRSVTANGTATANATFIINDSNDTLNLANGNYILSSCPAGGDAGAGYYAIFFGVNSDGSGNVYDAGSGVNVPFSNNGGYYHVAVGVRGGVTVSNLVFKPMIRLASVADATYAPYQATPYTVQIGQTVYGLRHDWLTGKAWIEWACYSLTSKESPTMATAEGNELFFYSFDDIPSTVKGQGTQGFLCSHYPIGDAVWTNTTMQNKVVNSNSNKFQPGFVFALGTYGSVDVWESFVDAQAAAGTPVQLAWPLATPIEIQLTPHIISAVEPEQTNTLYGDGTIDVEYVKPLHVSIEERVAAAVAALTTTE